MPVSRYDFAIAAWQEPHTAGSTYPFEPARAGLSQSTKPPASSSRLSAIAGIRPLPPIVPVHHGEPRHRRLKVRNSLSLERSDVGRPQIRPAERNTRHPRSDTAAGREQHLFANVIGEELPLERIDLLGVAFVQQN